ncbi:MAG: hypothetical protein E7620_07630 [Ruminococcaceae bacterium]|nr:hypothetical protein [Oscillospiraceae bacterium]
MKTTAKTFKKALALMLCLAMCAALLVPVASAETPAGTPITSEAELRAMTSNNTYYLANDIVLAEKWTPLAKLDSFVLDGNGKTISNFIIDDTSVGSFANVGLISEIDANSTIKNLTIKGTMTFNAKSGLCVGPFVGAVRGGTVDNCVSYTTVTVDTTVAGNNYVGGIVGLTHTASDVLNCVNYGDVTNITTQKNTQYAAGIVGSVNYGLLVENCVNYGKIHAYSGENGFAGGMVGRLTYKADNQQTIRNCQNFGEVSADFYAAGIVAQNSSWGLDVIGCENYGYIHCETAASGIHGWVRQESSTSTYRAGTAVTISRCVNFGAIEAFDAYGQYATGIVTGSHNAAKSMVVKVEYCANMGNVTTHASAGDAQSGGIFGRAGNMHPDSSVSYCYNAGTCTAPERGEWMGDICGSDGSLKYNYNFSSSNGVLFQHNSSGNAQYKVGNETITENTDLTAVVATLNTGLETPAFRLNKGAIEPIYSLNSEAVVNVGVQETQVKDGKFSVRFISYVNALSYDEAGFMISATIVQNGETTNVAAKKYVVNTVFDSLTADTENGLAKIESPLGTDYLALVMNNIPANATVTFTFTPYAVSGDNTVNGNAITMTYVNGVLA